MLSLPTVQVHSLVRKLRPYKPCNMFKTKCWNFQLVKKKHLGFLYSVVSLLSVLYIFWIKVICKIHVYGMFSPNCGLYFHFPNKVRKLLILMKPTYKLFMAHAFILKILNLCHFQVHNDLLMFSSRNVFASALFMS